MKTKTNDMEAAKAALAEKRRAEADATLQAKIDQDRRDVPPGIEVTEAVEATAAAASAAFIKAQSEFGVIPFDKQNPHFKSKYASLGAVLRATLPALIRHGISLQSPTEVIGDEIYVKTWLIHNGLVFAVAQWPVGKVGTPPQQLGSALTYARRYTIQSILGVVADDDDDGNAAQSAAKPEADPF